MIILKFIESANLSKALIVYSTLYFSDSNFFAMLSTSSKSETYTKILDTAFVPKSSPLSYFDTNRFHPIP